MARYYLQYGMGLDVDDVAGEIYIEHDGGIPTLDDNFIRAEGIMEQLQVRRATAYRIMSKLPRYKLYDERATIGTRCTWSTGLPLIHTIAASGGTRSSMTA